jgi:hypothetical protein
VYLQLGSYLKSRALNLSNALHVPSVTKNLDSISRLTKDNNVIVGLNSFFIFRISLCLPHANAQI